MTDTARNVMRVLREIGFVEVRAAGSNRIFKRGDMMIPVPYHPGDLNRKTFHRTLKQAGLSVDEYLALR
jgi:predicted RNA binding protein YcfA (HicA-like mRNA interferase family)